MKKIQILVILGILLSITRLFSGCQDKPPASPTPNPATAGSPVSPINVTLTEFSQADLPNMCQWDASIAADIFVNVCTYTWDANANPAAWVPQVVSTIQKSNTNIVNANGVMTLSNLNLPVGCDYFLYVEIRYKDCSTCCGRTNLQAFNNQWTAIGCPLLWNQNVEQGKPSIFLSTAVLRPGTGTTSIAVSFDHLTCNCNC